MTTKEIRRALRTIHREGLEQSAAIRDILQRKSRFDATAKSWKLKHLEPGPGRATNESQKMA
jgi:hypothetical protein